MNRLRATALLGVSSSLGKNILSLYFLQFANYVLPLATIPYLVRVLGPENYGIIAFGQSLITYFVIVVNYGFAWSATRDISVHREDMARVSRTASGVWGAQLLFGLAGFVVLLLLISLVPKLRDISPVLLILYGIVLGNALFPDWLFLGLERMVAISLINLITRLVGALGIFTLIHQPSDYVLYAALLSFQWIAAGILGVWFALAILKVRVTMPCFGDIWRVLRDGAMLFLSSASHSLYTSSNSLILGLLTNYTAVGYYSGAEKIVLTVLNLLDPVSKAVYPRFSKMASVSTARVLFWGRRLLYAMGTLGIGMTIVLFSTAPFAVDVILGPKYGPAVVVARILSFLPVSSAVGYVLGTELMLPFGMDRYFMCILVGAGVVNIALAAVLAPMWQASGMATAYLVSETFVTGSMFACLSYRRLNPLFYRPQLTTDT